MSSAECKGGLERLSQAPYNKQLERTVIRRRGDGPSAPFHYALVPRFIRRRAAAELRRYAGSLALGRLVYLALLLVPSGLWASGGIFAEGYSSPAPGAPSQISFRAFTIYTWQDACAKSGTPSELKVMPNPITLNVGDRIHRTNVSEQRSEIIVEAYGARGLFLPAVPIIVSTVDPNGVLGNRSDWDYFEAVGEGEAELVVGWACQQSGGAPLQASVRIIVTSSVNPAN
jgi:hypothetical protein